MCIRDSGHADANCTRSELLAATAPSGANKLALAACSKKARLDRADARGERNMVMRGSLNAPDCVARAL